MALEGLLWCVAALLGLGAAALATTRHTIVYGISLGVTVLALVISLSALLGQALATLTLPLGLPWLGARVHLGEGDPWFFAANAYRTSAGGCWASRRSSPASNALPF